LSAAQERGNNFVYHRGDRVAHYWRGLRRIILCADWQGEAMVMGDYVGCGWVVLLDSAADLGEFVFAA
jgi:hypothetical protein